MSARDSQIQDGSKTVIRRIVEHGVRPLSGDQSGQSSTTNQVITSIVRQHADEQKQLQELNNKFAAYLDRVHYLEDRNKRLTNELDVLRRAWGNETSQIQSIYDPKLRDFRRSIDQSIKDQAIQELQLKRYEYDIYQIQQQINSLNPEFDREKLILVKNQLDRSAVELDEIRVQFDQRLQDLARQRETMEFFLSDLNNLKNELDSRQVERIVLENEIQTLREHGAFQDAIYQVQRSEFQSLETPSLDVSGFYRTELARAISEIRSDFEVLSQSRRNELEQFYRLKTEEIRNKIGEEEERRRISAKESVLESTDTGVLANSVRGSSDELQNLKEENRNLQKTIDALLADLETIQIVRERENLSLDNELVELESEIERKRALVDSVLENNVSLQFEISTYRNLLAVEENHLNRTASNAERGVSSIVSASTQPLKQFGTKKMTVSKTARGPIAIDSVDLDSDSIVLINEKFSGNSQSLENWSLRRKIDEQDEIVYSFPASTSLKPRESIRIVSRQSPTTSRLSSDVLFAEKIPSWGIGQKMITRLVDEKNEEKSIVTQTFQ